MNALRLLAVGAIVWWAFLARPSPTPATVQAYDVTTGGLIDARTQWSIDFLAGLGNTQPALDTLAYVNAWQGGEGTGAQFNPLATTHTLPGATCYNARPCVKNYQTHEEGLYATVQTITNGRYPNILAGLRTNDVERALNHEELGTWGTGYGNVAGRYDEELAALVALFSTNRYSGAENVPTHPTIGRGSVRPNARMGAVAIALEQVGKGYTLGTEGPDTFDCSGLVEWSFGQVGIETSRTTYTQLDRLQPLLPEQVEVGDMVYFQYPWDQHVGLLFVGSNGNWSMVHAATPDLGVIITDNVFDDPFYREAIIGYRRAQ